MSCLKAAPPAMVCAFAPNAILTFMEASRIAWLAWAILNRFSTFSLRKSAFSYYRWLLLLYSVLFVILLVYTLVLHSILY